MSLIETPNPANLSSASASRPRVLSGMRPTGRLHLGNYMGALHNWVRLQHEYDCYFFIADLHALTTGYADTSELVDNVDEIALDFLSAGLDPEKCVIFLQSAVPTHDQLNTLLGMFTPLGWLERVPTYKDQQEQLREKDLATYGFLGYPLLQSADILLYKPDFVPVGADQVAHVELTREVARRFNQLYPGDFYLSPDAAPWEMDAVKTRARKISGDKAQEKFSPHQLFEAAKQTKKLSPFGIREVLPEPEALLTPSPKLPGLDGRKMSKSYKNTIMLSEPEADLCAKLKGMVTDPARVRREDPGDPEVCPVFDLHKVFSPLETQMKAAEGCRTASIGCIECKSWLAGHVNEALEPIRVRRAEYAAKPELVTEILAAGAERALARTRETLREVHEAMGIRRRRVTHAG